MTTKAIEPRGDIEKNIRDALDRLPGLSVLRIEITVDGSCARLCGIVWPPARASPGVSTVKNYLSLNLFQSWCGAQFWRAESLGRSLTDFRARGSGSNRLV
jgi:hypothetical protein